MRKNLDGGLLHAMHAFIKVIDSGSFTAAAEQMDLTTAQISRLVSELEKRVGASLLQRTTRKRILTDIGANFAERCREIVSLVDEAEAQAAGTAATPQGRLRVQCMANFGQHYVAPVMADFCGSHPQLTVEYSTSQYVPDLLSRGVDVSLYLAESLGDSGLVARRIGTTFSILCASPAYLKQHGTPTTPEDLHRYSCVRLINPSITAGWRLMNRDASIKHVDINGRLIADTPELLLDVVLRGAGITLLPLFSVIDSVKSGRLQRILPDWRSPDIGVYSLRPSRHYMDAKTRAWLDWVELHICPQIAADTQYFS
ncbi:LysR family transcriptional regulator [Advenella mimigardefordensis]|uniref:Transcriptional regulator, LysR family n=1 Tax=Advenella mimigardefordensis (strain DSM 17166 / LMG 22922 / DPN7) TaxID=1247726 RepID=W0PD40_ADVMD|nr:LysR family transcriptional regulator [Advenella mimigardefordensis]AHG63382.1 transcriptional regulator, LysR family [Advenella mimigardefordensis DPN7]